MKKYTSKDYNLYEFEDNCQNYLIVKDFRHEDIAAVFDWDLTVEEVDAIVERFEGEGLYEDEFKGDEWLPFEELTAHMWGCKYLTSIKSMGEALGRM